MTALSPDVVALRRRRSRRRSEMLQLSATLPALLWFLVFTIGPLVSLFYFSTVNWRGLIAPRTPAGFENFVRLAGDPVVWLATGNTILQLVVTLPIVVVGAFMIAYYLNLKPRGHRFVRALMFTPVLLSASALAMVFIGVFAPKGMINGFLEILGLEQLARPWLANGDSAMLSIIIVTIWCSMSVSAIMLAARLNSIDASVFEAAEIDGCGHFRRMWSIAWPMCREFVGVVTMLQFLWTLFSSAAVVLLLTKGGPGNATATLSFLVYDFAFNQSKVGYSQAVAVVLFVVGVVGILVIRRAFRQKY
ncbi:sugar ABC transporter permease [Microbacterium sp. LWH11-1.2]|uniref:carbohydrate ABC transporter permease n=1 Tax=Microbacterium sp. LWH11-1.2 TaxID=3135258 RepID=UPI003139B15D